MADEACEGGGSDQEEIAIDGSPLLTPPVVINRVELSPTKPVISSSVVAASGRPAGQKRMLLPFPTEKIDKNKPPTQRPRDQPPATPVRTAFADSATIRFDKESADIFHSPFDGRGHHIARE
jgi:hypothetical protein